MVYLGYLLDKNYFDNNGSQIYLVFQAITTTFTSVTGNTETNLSWRSRALSKESIGLPLSPGYNLNSKQKWIINSKIAVNVNGDYSTQSKPPVAHRNVVKLFILFELDTCSNNLITKFTLRDCLLVVVYTCLLMLIQINVNIVAIVLKLMHVHIFQ